MGERWDRDRFMLERERNRDGGRFEEDRFSMRGAREEDRFSMRGARGGREHSVDERRFNRGFDDDDTVRDRRYYEEETRRRETFDPERPRPRVMERERELPARRPGFLRRQSSLDTFDRRPRIFDQREEYGPPARREDYRAPAYTPIPLPKTRALPPPRRFPDQGFYDDIKVAEPDYYGDDDFRPYPDRIREREYAHTRRRRSRSRESHSTRTRSHRSSSVSSSTSRSSSSSGGTTVRSEYPKKGKTRIPAKLVSKRALIDLGYPFFEEGNTIIVQKALGQDNIDELLKVSEDYKKVEAEIAASRKPMQALPAPESKPPKSTTGVLPSKPPPSEARPAPPPETVKEPKAEPPQQPKQQQPPPQQAPPREYPPQHAPPREYPPPPPPVNHVPRQPMPPMPPVQMAPPPPQPPVVVQPPPPPGMYPPAAYEVDDFSVRDVSPDRSSSTSSSWESRSTHRRRRKSAGPVILAGRSRSRSRSGRDIRAEIKALERELAHRPKGGSSREIVQAERLPSGEVVIYEDRVEKVVEHHKPPRIEKDKKGPPPALVRAMLKTLT